MRTFIDKFEAGFHRLNVFIAALVAISIGLWAVLISFDLLMVRMGWGNLPWMTAVIEYSLYAGVFLGAPWVLQLNAHVRVDVLIGGLSERAGGRLELLVDLVGAALCAGLAYYGVQAAISDFAIGELNDKYVPLPGWQLLTVFAVSFVMLAIEFLLRARHAFDPRTADATGETGF